ncbi:MAG: c-type cytochrome [Gemmatimonadota bacterium]|nr:MAG: c-type cytochrome [Gemmatimonadota bacterium]
MNRIAGLAVLILLAGTTALSAQDAEAGKATFATCAACHGTDGGGNKALNAPALAGQEAWYVERQLNNFKSGVRGAGGDAFGAQMVPMAAMLATDADVKNVAAYVASLPPVSVTHDGFGDAVAGQALYASCAACHGAAGEGNTALNAPNLAIQQDWYLVRQLEHFKSGERGTNPGDVYGAQMRPMAMILADAAAMKNVAAYIASLGN